MIIKTAYQRQNQKEIKISLGLMIIKKQITNSMHQRRNSTWGEIHSHKEKDKDKENDKINNLNAFILNVWRT